MSQWSTLPSGPLARLEGLEKGGNWGKSREPVVHFVDWTTSSEGKVGKWRKLGQKLRSSGPLHRVDHWLEREA